MDTYFFGKNFIKDNMENKKDIKRQEGGNKLIKDDTSSSEILNFNDNNGFYSLILKRMEKLGTASYMITDHLDDAEPIKVSIRTCALALLKDMYSPEYHIGKKHKKEKTISTLICIEQILTLFDIAHISRMISTGNHAVIVREFSIFRKAVEDLIKTEESRIVFPVDLFATKEEREMKGNPQDTYFNSRNLGDGKNTHKGQFGGSILLKSSPSRVFNNKNNIKPNKEDRMNLILKLIKKDMDVSIKDIHNHFADCSEKTIQRELAKMLLKGLIVRKGDKRWSRYSLK